MTIYLALEKGLPLRKVPGSRAAMGGDQAVLRRYLEDKLMISYIKEKVWLKYKVEGTQEGRGEHEIVLRDSPAAMGEGAVVLREYPEGKLAINYIKKKFWL